jgi:hypothetical protein
MTTKTKPKLLDLIEALTPVVRIVMREKYDSNCCIATCGVLRRALQHFGYESEPMPCTVGVFNAAMVKLLKTGMRFPEDYEERLRLASLFGAWGVGLVPVSAPMGNHSGFGGHVVLRVQQTVIDASIEQAQRPDKNMTLPPLLAFELGCEFLLQPRGQRFECLLPDGVNIIYERSTDYSFRFATDWQRTGSPYVETLSKVVRETRARLD